jgi:hypothetical protein
MEVKDFNFRKEVIENLEALIKKGEKMFFSRRCGPEHISKPLQRVLETFRIMRILNKALNEIKEGGEGNGKSD